MESYELPVAATLEKFSSAIEESSQLFRRPTGIKQKVRKYTEMLEHEEEPVFSNKAVRPWNYSDFVRRVKTFHRAGYWFAKPESQSSIRCARYGWINTDVDTLFCPLCNKSVVIGDKEIVDLTLAHETFCGWRDNCCSDSFEGFQPLTSAQCVSDITTRCNFLLACVEKWRNETHEETSNRTLTIAVLPEFLESLISKESVKLTLVQQQEPSCDTSFDEQKNVEEEGQEYLISVDLEAASVDSWFAECRRMLRSYISNNSAGLLSSFKQVRGNPLFDILLVLALCGWTRHTPAQTSAVHPSSDASPLPESQTMSKFVDKLECQFCGRIVRLTGSVFHPIRKHRPYCVWVADRAGSPCGWKYCKETLQNLGACEQPQGSVQLTGGVPLSPGEPTYDINKSTDGLEVYRRVRNILQHACT